MKYIHDNGFKTLTTDELYKWHQGLIELPRKSVMVTFDDGFYEVYHRALPIMEKYNIHSAVFVVGRNLNPVTEEMYPNLSKHFIGKDVVFNPPPPIEFQSHSYALQCVSPWRAI